MDRRRIFCGLLIILILCTTAFIWSNSLENANESSVSSRKIVDFIKPFIDPNNRIDYDTFTTVIRKLAHFSEFALLGTEITLFILSLKGEKIDIKITCVVTAILGLLISVIDELLQLTSDGRSCEITDVLIDFSGLISGLIIVLLVRCVVISVKNRQKI